jgi:hypothetical protein
VTRAYEIRHTESRKNGSVAIEHRREYDAAMVDVTLLNDRAVFEVEGLHRLWALRSRLEIPLAHITDAEFDPDQVGVWWHGWKLAGTDVPGLFAAGTFYYHGELVFWDVHDPARTIIVSLDHERYKKLILEVADPEGVVTSLRTALRK